MKTCWSSTFGNRLSFVYLHSFFRLWHRVPEDWQFLFSWAASRTNRCDQLCWSSFDCLSFAGNWDALRSILIKIYELKDGERECSVVQHGRAKPVKIMTWNEMHWVTRGLRDHPHMPPLKNSERMPNPGKESVNAWRKQVQMLQMKSVLSSATAPSSLWIRQMILDQLESIQPSESPATIPCALQPTAMEGPDLAVDMQDSESIDHKERGMACIAPGFALSLPHPAWKQWRPQENIKCRDGTGYHGKVSMERGVL